MQPPSPLTSHVEDRQTLRLQVLAVLEQLRLWAATAPADHQPGLAEYADTVDELAQFLDAGTGAVPKRSWHILSKEQRVQFGKLLRDKRNAAGFSRAQLARRAKLSDATLKFTETARNPPSRATLLRLIAVTELNLSWSDIPGNPAPPAGSSSDVKNAVSESPGLQCQLNCFLTPSYDPLATVTEIARFLDGAGGHVEQTHAYLDPSSAGAYLAICHNSIATTDLRARMPLALAAKQILTASGSVGLQVLALGAGDGILEARLVTHLLDQHVPNIELCLLDISQPLLSCAYLHATDVLASAGKAKVWAVQCNFHHLPLYTKIYAPTARRQRRLFCLLGGTLANLDHEPRFLRQSLLNCEAGDLLLLDIPTIAAPGNQSEDIKRRDKLYSSGISPQYADWLGGTIWRYGKEVSGIDFQWKLDTYCPVPGSYTLHAIATVSSPKRLDRQFSLFRFTRYDPSKLAQCLSEIGWVEIGALPYGNEHSLRLYRKRDDGKLNGL